MPLRLLLFVLAFVPALLPAGKIPASHPRKIHFTDTSPLLFHATFYAEAHYFSFPDNPGTLTVKFPYTLTNTSTGVNSSSVFSASKTNLTDSGKFYWTLPGVEIGYGRFSADANMNFATGPTNWTNNFYFGLNYRLPAPGIFRKTGGWTLAGTEIPGENFGEQFSDFSIQLCFGIEYYHPLFLLGEIPAGSYEKFSALGYTLPGKDTLADQAGTLNVYFQQNTIAFTPAISISYRSRYFKFLYFGFRIAPMLMIAQEGGLRFHYVKNDIRYKDYAPGGYNLRYINLRSDGLDSTFNGETISDTPFHLSGWMLTVRIGFGPCYMR